MSAQTAMMAAGGLLLMFLIFCVVIYFKPSYLPEFLDFMKPFFELFGVEFDDTTTTTSPDE